MRRKLYDVGLGVLVAVSALSTIGVGIPSCVQLVLPNDPTCVGCGKLSTSPIQTDGGILGNPPCHVGSGGIFQNPNKAGGPHNGPKLNPCL